MYIGEVSKKTGATIKAIRFYEELGLLFNVGRSGRYRVYDETHILLIQLIKQAKKQGFKLAEIKRAMSFKNEEQPWLEVLKMIEQKEKSLLEEIQMRQAQREALSEYHVQIKDCLSNNPLCKLEDTS